MMRARFFLPLLAFAALSLVAAPGRDRALLALAERVAARLGLLA